LDKSIDFVVLNSILPLHFDAISDFLKGHGFAVKYDGLVTDPAWGFERMRKFKTKQGASVIVYYRPTSPYVRTLWVQLMQPTRALLEALDTFFTDRGLSPRIRKLELSFDFYTKEPGLMWQFLIAHAFLKHQRSESKIYKGTFYTNDLRNAACGLRCYKKMRNVSFVRLELHISKGPVRRCGLGWLLDELDAFPLHKHFAFMEMVEARAVNTVARQFPPVGNPNGTLRELLKSKMGRRIAESWVRTVYPQRVGLMKQVEQFKDRETGLNKPERFFRLIPFNRLIFAALAKLKFLP